MSESINFVAARLTRPQEADLAQRSQALLKYVEDPCEAALVAVRPDGTWPAALTFQGEDLHGEWKPDAELFQAYGLEGDKFLDVEAWKQYCLDADFNLAVASLAASMGTDSAHLYYSEEKNASGFALFGADGGIREAFSYGAGGGDALLRYKNGELSLQNIPRDLLPFDYASPFFEGLARFFGLSDEHSGGLEFLEDVYSPDNCVVREYSLMEEGEKLAEPELRD